MMGMKYSFEAKLELARRLSAIFQRSASNFSIPWRGSAVLLHASCLLVPGTGLTDATDLASIVESSASLRFRPL